MALNLDGLTQYLYATSWNPHSGAYPVTIAGWFYTTNLTQNAAIACWDDNNASAVGANLGQLFGGGTSPDDPLRCMTYVSSWATATSTTGAGSATWHHFAFVWAANADRRVYIDGGSKGTDANSRTGAGVTNLGFGARYAAPGGSTADLLYAGKLAHVGVWTSALTDANVLSLAGGDLPTAVDASNLEEYWDFIADSNSDGGNTGSTLTEVGSPTYDADDPLDTTTYVDIAASGSMVFEGTAGLTKSTAVELAASGDIVFTGTAAITKQVVVKGLTADGTRMLIGLGNDELWYEGV